MSTNLSCYSVRPEELLKRLCRARDTARDPQLIILDLRECAQYQVGHILTAILLSCHTKTMAKHALSWWDQRYATERSCPASAKLNTGTFSTQISHITVPDILIYDQKSVKAPDDVGSPVAYFIGALLERGNAVFFLTGGFEAFQRLRSSDFVDRGLPMSRLNNFEQVHQEPQQPARIAVVALGAAPTSLGIDLKSGIKTMSCDNLAKQSMKQKAIKLKKTESTISISDMHRIKYPWDVQHDIKNTGISKILPYLYLGNEQDAQNVDLLRNLKVTHIINVTNCVPMPLRNSLHLKYLHLPASDNSQQDLRPAFDCAISFIDDAKKSKGIVLVHCQAGVSRSVAVVLAYILHVNRNWNLMQALEFVHNRRPIVGPNLHFMGQLQLYYDELHKTQAPRFP